MSRLPMLGLIVLLTTPGAALGQSASTGACPVTIGAPGFVPPVPDCEHCYGSEVLAVELPPTGQWPVTAPGARIAVKHLVWSVGFKPGMERNLTVRIESLTDHPNDALVKDITNIIGAEPSDGAAMLVGIDFPSAGCWRITLDYLGQSLSYVVETVAAKPDDAAT